jgi:hypothetical protein
LRKRSDRSFHIGDGELLVFGVSFDAVFAAVDAVFFAGDDGTVGYAFFKGWVEAQMLHTNVSDLISTFIQDFVIGFVLRTREMVGANRTSICSGVPDRTQPSARESGSC